MNLDNLQFRASTRSGWQSLDLGFLMAREWWWPLFMATTVPALLLYIPLSLWFFEQPIVAPIIIWWLKPFWERLPLYYASRRIFDESIDFRQLAVQFKSLYLKDCIPWLLWRRLSLQRAFDAPVTVLENLRGAARGKRLHTLHGKYSDIAFASQLVCTLFEIITCIGLLSTAVLLIPDEFNYALFNDSGTLNPSGRWLFSLFAFASMMIIIPFHTLAGFSLYLNRRIELEAWDIEISFRSLAERKRAEKNRTHRLLLPMLATVILATLLLTPVQSLAQQPHDRESARELISQVLQGEDFGAEKTIRKWRFRNLVEDNSDRIPQWMIDLVQWLEDHLDLTKADGTFDASNFGFADWFKFILILLFVSIIVYLLYRFRTFTGGRTQSPLDTDATPDVMFGLDVSPQSLPENVPQQVLKLWRQANHRQALSLLYRATLSRLIERYQLGFKSSHTEIECVRLVIACGKPALSDYFTRLTQAWRQLAYAHRLPDSRLLHQLCEQWIMAVDDEKK